jgi:threonine dehydrogenase-like Zn-dependent dehydrogenase
MSSRNATRQDFEQVVQCIQDGRIDPLAFVTSRVLFSEAADGFADWLNPSRQTIKVMVEND